MARAVRPRSRRGTDPPPRAGGTLADRAYLRLKSLILTARVLPGNRLLHRVLVRRLGMSSTPLREAMGRLIQEGYVRHAPNHGYSVRELDPEEADRLFEAREALEAATAALAAARIRAAELKEVEGAARAFRGAIARRPHKTRVLLDIRFHLAIARLARNPYLYGALESLLHQLAATRNVEGIPPEQGGLRADRAHRRIVAALRLRSPAAAREAMREHIRRSRAFVVRELRQRAGAGGVGGGPLRGSAGAGGGAARAGE